MATPTPTPAQSPRPQPAGKAPETETKMPQQPPMGAPDPAQAAAQAAQVQGEIRALTQRVDAMEQKLAQVTGHPEIAKLMQPMAGPGQPLQPGQAGTPQQKDPVTALG